MIPNTPQKLQKSSWRITRLATWWKTVAESPDLNPIENLWHKLKEFIRREVKQMTKDELINERFWRTVDVAKCTKYIRHLRKVIPKVIECHGEPTGY